MNELLDLLESVRDDIDFESCDTLIDDGVLESFDIIQIIAAINDEYDIEIPATAVSAENFNSAEALLALIEKLKED